MPARLRFLVYRADFRLQLLFFERKRRKIAPVHLERIFLSLLLVFSQLNLCHSILRQSFGQNWSISSVFKPVSFLSKH